MEQIPKCRRLSLIVTRILHKEHKKKTVNITFTVFTNRSDGIRTHDPFVPNEVR